MSIQDIGTGTGPRVRQAADLAGLSVAEFMALPKGTQAFHFGQLADESLPSLWHPSDVDPFATFADDGGETVAALYAEHRAQQDEVAVPLAEALAPYEGGVA